MFKTGDIVKSKHDGKIGAIIGVENIGTTVSYSVLLDGVVCSRFEEQIEIYEVANRILTYSADEVNSLITAKLLLNPNINSLYSHNSAKIDYISYQFRPVLKLIKSESPRILIADGVGVGKTIEAGLILKELESRFDIKSVLVICPRPLITEKKWQNEMRDKFGERFVHIDGEKLRYCIDECCLDEEWPSEYEKCIIPYSLFDEAVVNGTAYGGVKKLRRKSLTDLNPFPKFDLVIIDEAHHIKNPNTYAYQATQMFCENASSIVMLTATPIQLGDRDLFILLNLLRPDLVYDYDSFVHMSEPNPYINEAVRLIRENKENWQSKALEDLISAGNTSWGKSLLVKNPVYQNALKTLAQDTISREERVELITNIENLHTFAGIINRTRRRDIGAFTVRKPETVKVRFSADQAALYNELLRIQADILRQLHGDKGIRFMMTTIMRQASSCIHGLRPFLEGILTRRFDELGFYNGDMGTDAPENTDMMNSAQIVEAVKRLLEFTKNMSDEDSKVEELIRAIKDKQTMENNKVMVFSCFRHTLSYLYKKLTEQGVRVGIIHGGVKDEDRVALRNRFKADREQKESLDVLLFSEVGCEGLDYQFCDCIVNYDLPWNPQKIEQRIGRIDRNGQQSESISIINIITEGTIDCEIYDRCLSRIGVFNSSIGDSEEILGKVTQEIYDIVDMYILDAEEREQKELQIADNAIREMQEQQRLEDEKYTFFNLSISDEIMKKELKDAINIHLGEKAISNLVETYLKRRLGSSEQYILGKGTAKTLKINESCRGILLKDFSALERQTNPVYKAWSKYLSDNAPYEKITFNGEYATEHNEVMFIMPTHPLVKQAVNYFRNEPVQCNLCIKTDKLPQGSYPFVVYDWKYKGIKPTNEIIVITQEQIDSKLMLELIFNSDDVKDVGVSVQADSLEELHFSLWKNARQKYLTESEQIINYRLENLIVSQQGQIKAIQNALNKATNERIIKMKMSQLDNLQHSFEEKQTSLKTEIDKCDIVASKLVLGILDVEN
ncbi:MAG: SNF2-related protein [Clostridiales bacterium]|nr:SNF2-related protein [Clostridiales bacterium]